jgi:hypothetical protein
MIKVVQLFFAIICCGLVETRAERFQIIVVAGEVTTSKPGTPLEKLAFIDGNHTLYVAKHAYVALMDSRTNMFEFYGERTILLDTLNGNYLGVSRFPNVSLLYRTARPETRIHDDSRLEMEMCSPFLFSNKMRGTDTTRITWIVRSSKKEKYKLKIESEYQDEISAYEVTGDEMVVTLSKDHMRYPNLILIVQAENKPIEEVYANYRILNFQGRGLTHDVSVNLNSAAGCLILALFLETRAEFDKSLVYYKRAVSIAPDVAAYMDILSNFKSMWKLP